MARLLLLAGDGRLAGHAARAWARRRPGAAWLDVAELAGRVSPGTGAGDAGEAGDPGSALGAAVGWAPAEAAITATCAAAVELVAAGLDVAVAGGPADRAAYAGAWQPLVGAVDHRVVVVGDAADGWDGAHHVPAGAGAGEVAAALDAQLAVPGSAWRHDVLEDGAVRLRPVRAGDVPAVLAACQDPEISRWTTVPAPYEEAHAVEFVRLSAAARRRGTGATFAVVDRATDVLVGTVGLVDVNWRTSTATVGYWVAAGARGRGVARRALALLDRWAFDRLGLARLRLDVMVGNEASCRVAEACGYRREGVRRAIMPACGGRVDLIGYGLLRADLDDREEATVA